MDIRFAGMAYGETCAAFINTVKELCDKVPILNLDVQVARQWTKENWRILKTWSNVITLHLDVQIQDTEMLVITASQFDTLRAIPSSVPDKGKHFVLRFFILHRESDPQKLYTEFLKELKDCIMSRLPTLQGSIEVSRRDYGEIRASLVTLELRAS